MLLYEGSEIVPPATVHQVGSWHEAIIAEFKKLPPKSGSTHRPVPLALFAQRVCGILQDLRCTIAIHQRLAQGA
jgi:hypothetical protein